MKTTVRVVKHELLSVLLLPLWWYTVGAVRCIRRCVSLVSAADLRFGFSVWLRHIATPMYGATDAASRIISFFVRCVMIVVRGVGVFAALCAAVLIFLLYIAFPVIAVSQIIAPSIIL